ncbi:unnamed protein product [Brachionus calyciflorus]|uniref:Reelin domain-containing protein n=1 Tax=Brachionus calyciflorus TaxID=104777 RepID=A0A813M0X9_9BILA|nr:unnamed protein product [Brachionus calyciflorus]
MISKSLIFLLTLSVVLAYPSGAPDSVCESMVPQHGYDPITSENPPFEIVYSKMNHTERTLLVTIQSKEESKRFKGFLIQARRDWKGEAIGKWSTEEDNTKTLECFEHEDSAVTHNHKPKGLSREKGFDKLNFQWTMPEDMESMNGTILLATVAENGKVIYLNVSTIVICNNSKSITDEKVLRDEVVESETTTEKQIEDEKHAESHEVKHTENKEETAPEKQIENEKPHEAKHTEDKEDENIDKDEEIRRLKEEIKFLKFKLNKFLSNKSE